MLVAKNDCRAFRATSEVFLFHIKNSKKHSLENCYRAETATPLFMREKSKRVILLPCLGPNTFTCWKGRNPLFLQKCKPLYCALFNFPLDYSCLHTIWPFSFSYLPFFIYFLKSETSLCIMLRSNATFIFLYNYIKLLIVSST